MGYTYSMPHAIGQATSERTPQAVMGMLQRDPGRYFPFTVVPVAALPMSEWRAHLPLWPSHYNPASQPGSIILGASYSLDSVRFPGDTGNWVTVTSVTPTSFTFTALAGHFDFDPGAPAQITFETSEKDGKIYLTQIGNAPHADMLNSVLVKSFVSIVWDEQAHNLSEATKSSDQLQVGSDFIAGQGFGHLPVDGFGEPIPPELQQADGQLGSHATDITHAPGGGQAPSAAAAPQADGHGTPVPEVKPEDLPQVVPTAPEGARDHAAGHAADGHAGSDVHVPSPGEAGLAAAPAEHASGYADHVSGHAAPAGQADQAQVGATHHVFNPDDHPDPQNAAATYHALSPDQHSAQQGAAAHHDSYDPAHTDAGPEHQVSEQAAQDALAAAGHYHLDQAATPAHGEADHYQYDPDHVIDPAQQADQAMHQADQGMHQVHQAIEQAHNAAVDLGNQAMDQHL
jgi:hypothetical protein